MKEGDRKVRVGHVIMETEAQMIKLLAGRRPHAKGNRQPLEPGEDKEMDFPLESPKGTQLCSQVDFSPLRPILDS